MYVETSDDLNRKYQNTWLRYRGSLILVHAIMDELDKDGQHIKYLSYYASPDAPRAYEPLEVEKIEVLAPESMFVPVPPQDKINWGAVRLTRVPKRQWRRSLCRESWTGNNPFADAARMWNIDIQRIGNVAVNGLHWQMALAVHNAKYPAWIEALARLEKQPSVALSPQLALMWHPADPKWHLLWTQAGIVGRVSADGLNITVEHHVYGQEIQDFVNRQNISTRVTYA